jgi:MFS family permease
VLYPVYALLFADAGLSTAEISSLFAIWSATGFLLEVPSGVWADAVSRRLLLAVAPLLSGAGFALWVLAPSYPAFAAGFALWGAQGALASGALEALVYDELDRAGAASRYAVVMGRASAAGTAASALAMAAAAPVLHGGGFAALGACSVGACLLAALAGAALPEARRPDGADDGEPAPGFGTLLRAAGSAVRADPAVWLALVLVPAVTAIWGSLDEYLPLLAVEAGAATEEVPALGLIVYAGVAAGGLAAGAAGRLGPRGFATVLLGAAGALGAGAAMGVPAGFAVIALAFACFQALTVAADARLQDAVGDGPRSTLTSVAGLLTEVGVLAVFGAYAAGSALAGHATLFVVFAALHVLVAAWLLRRRTWRPGAAGG